MRARRASWPLSQPIGDPVLLTLLELETPWRDGSPAAVIHAVQLCAEYERPMPSWLVKAVIELAKDRISDRDRRNFRNKQIHYARWDAVVELRERRLQQMAEHGDDRAMTWPNAYVAVSELLEGSPAAGSPEAVEFSYKLVQREMSGLGGQF